MSDESLSERRYWCKPPIDSELDAADKSADDQDCIRPSVKASSKIQEPNQSASKEPREKRLENFIRNVEALRSSFTEEEYAVLVGAQLCNSICQIAPNGDGLQNCKIPSQLEIGDYFSYIGSFKVYQLLTKPEIDKEFESSYICAFCHQEARYETRFIFDVTDGNITIGIRLRSSEICTIHESFDYLQ